MDYDNNRVKMTTFYKAGWVVLALSMIILGVRLHLILSYGNHTPYWDDWGIGHQLALYVESGIDLSWIFGLTNEHRISFTKVLQLTLFELNSRQWDPFLGMVASAFLWTIAGAWLIRIALKSGAQINSCAAICLVMLLWVYPLSLFNITSTIMTYLYFMILFVLVGFWLCCCRPFSAKWICGMVLITVSCLTAAAGSFAPVAVASVSFFLAFFDRDKRRPHLTTALMASLLSVFTLLLILSQNRTGHLAQSFVFTSFITSFLKVLSWPGSNNIWPSVFFLSPILLLAYRISRAPAKAGRFGIYVLMLSAYSVLMACSIGFARSFGKGVGPAERYFDFLALYCVASFFALLLLQNRDLRWGRKINGLLVLGWVLAFVASVPFQFEVFNHNVADRAKLVPIQESIISRYTLTENQQLFENREFREVPYPFPDRLALAINKMIQMDVLPYQFQAPQVKLRSSRGPFIVGGFIDTKTHHYRVYDDVLTSYNVALGAQNAQGEYTGPVYASTRPFVMIPHTGYLGHAGLSLKLVGVTDGEEIEVKPPAMPSSFAQTWREEFVPAPKDGYRIVASDASKSLFFNIAAPRSVGALTYYTKQFLKIGDPIWKIGLLLLLIFLRHDIASALRVSSTPESSSREE